MQGGGSSKGYCAIAHWVALGLNQADSISRVLVAGLHAVQL